MCTQNLNWREQAVPDKADFDAVYDLPDPRGYFHTLGDLGYQIPHHAQPVFRRLLAERMHTDDSGARSNGGALNGTGSAGARPRPVVVDLCCSYGVNTALLNYGVTMEALTRRYTSQEMANLPVGEVMAIDREFFSARRLPTAAYAIGLDSSRQAVDYAVRIQVLDEGFAENLEADEPSLALQAALAGTRLITVTGGIGYISHRTIERIMACTSDPPWVAAFVLRVVPYQPVADVLADHGLVTERLEGYTFRQRRFATMQERESVLRELAVLGVGISGREERGYLHTELYVSRPATEVATQSLSSLLGMGW